MRGKSFSVQLGSVDASPLCTRNVQMEYFMNLNILNTFFKIGFRVKITSLYSKETAEGCNYLIAVEVSTQRSRNSVLG